jgi:hypothetical protein
MIRVRQTVRSTGAKELAEFYSIYPDFAQAEFFNTVEEFGPEIITLLSAPVGPVQYPIQWTNENQEWAYKLTDGFERGIPTQRTGALQKGWQQRTETQADKAVWVIENLVPYARFVVGTLNKDLRIAARTQQKFHANTGYPLAAATIESQLVDFRARYKDKTSPAGKPDFVRRASKSRGRI